MILVVGAIRPQKTLFALAHLVEVPTVKRVDGNSIETSNKTSQGTAEETVHHPNHRSGLAAFDTFPFVLLKSPPAAGFRWKHSAGNVGETHMGSSVGYTTSPSCDRQVGSVIAGPPRFRKVPPNTYRRSPLVPPAANARCPAVDRVVGIDGGVALSFQLGWVRICAGTHANAGKRVGGCAAWWTIHLDDAESNQVIP
jgi:hypothetical protein